jgi:protein-disulfide isomerase
LKIKAVLYSVLFSVGATFLVACTPSADQLKKVMKENPDILHAAIEADPKGFFEVVQKVQGTARDQQMEDQLAEEVTRVMKDMKSPKTVNIDDSRAIIGPKTAKITIVEWSDYNCGHCSHAHETVEKIVEEYKDQVRVVFKHLPILSKESRMAAEYMEAVALQDAAKAIKFHDAVFSMQREFREGGEAFIKKIVKEVGADVAKAQKDRSGSVVKKRIDGDVAEAKGFEFNGTPGFMVNGAAIHGAYPHSFFKKLIDSVLTK